MKIISLCSLFSFLFSFFFITYSQGTVKTRPESHGWFRVFDGTVGANGDGVDTTSAFMVRDYRGSITFFLTTDTTGASVKAANKSDSCLTLWFQVKRTYKDPNDGVVYGDWGGHYNETDLTKTRIDTVARSKINVGGAAFYFNPAQDASTPWAWGDSIRVIMGIGKGDSLKVTFDVGGI